MIRGVHSIHAARLFVRGIVAYLLAEKCSCAVFAHQRYANARMMDEIAQVAFQMTGAEVSNVEVTAMAYRRYASVRHRS